MAEQYGGEPVDTVFLGGGTPSVVPPEPFAAVLNALRARFAIRPDAEFTSETNPGTLTPAWLNAFLFAGGNRLSVGVQAKQERLLRVLGRIHTFDQALSALETAKRAGIGNINADAMFGLPTQTLTDYLDTLWAFADAGVTHVSAYSLILEEGTPLYESVRSGALALPGEDETADMMEAGVDRLEALGYRRYEISNFARPGYACRHNLGYWRQKRYLGLGASAASLLPAPPGAADAAYLRRTNTGDVRAYVGALQAGRLPPAETQIVTPREAMFETVLLGLRTVEGVRYADFERLHGVALSSVYGEAIDRLRTQGLLAPAGNADPRLALTRRGLALQNTALMAFMEADRGSGAPRGADPDTRPT